MKFDLHRLAITVSRSRFRRRWSYSLRMMLFVLTLAGACLGWIGREMIVVRNRTELRYWAEQNNMRTCTTVTAVRKILPVLRAGRFADYAYAPYEHLPQVSFIRCWMGDDAVAKMTFSVVPPAEKQAELRTWFPETDFHWQSHGFDD